MPGRGTTLIETLKYITVRCHWGYNPKNVNEVFDHLPDHFNEKEKAFEYIMQLIHEFFMTLPEKIKSQSEEVRRRGITSWSRLKGYTSYNFKHWIENEWIENEIGIIYCWGWWVAFYLLYNGIGHVEVGGPNVELKPKDLKLLREKIEHGELRCPTAAEYKKIMEKVFH